MQPYLADRICVGVQDAAFQVRRIRIEKQELLQVKYPLGPSRVTEYFIFQGHCHLIQARARVRQ